MGDFLAGYVLATEEGEIEISFSYPRRWSDENTTPQGGSVPTVGTDSI